MCTSPRLPLGILRYLLVLEKIESEFLPLTYFQDGLCLEEGLKFGVKIVLVSRAAYIQGIQYSGFYSIPQLYSKVVIQICNSVVMRTAYIVIQNQQVTKFIKWQNSSYYSNEFSRLFTDLKRRFTGQDTKELDFITAGKHGR